MTRNSLSRNSTARMSIGIIAIAATAMLLASCRPAPAPGTSSSPSGYLDSVVRDESNIRVQGWASDWNTRESINVVFMVNGVWAMGFFKANTARPDLERKYSRGANFGFDEILRVPGVGLATVCAVAINVGRGENTLLGCATANYTPANSIPAPEVTTTTSTSTTTTTTTSTTTTTLDRCNLQVASSDVVNAVC